MGPSLQEVAALLYQVEVKLLGRPSSAVPTKGPSASPEEDPVPQERSPVLGDGAIGQGTSESLAPEGRCKAVLAVMNAMVDGSTPPTAIPFLTSLIQAASTSLLESGSLTTVGTPSPPIPSVFLLQAAGECQAVMGAPQCGSYYSIYCSSVISCD